MTTDPKAVEEAVKSLKADAYSKEQFGTMIVANRTALKLCLTALEERTEALKPFAAVHNIQPPGKELWPDNKPNSEFIPGAWPTWKDFRTAARALGGHNEDR